MNRFWDNKTLNELSDSEWEALCDGCGKCCLQKLQDETTEALYFTDVACRYLNRDTCRCSDYPQRKRRVPECLVIRSEAEQVYEWLPSTCAYRLRWQGRALPHWHPLLQGNDTLMHRLGMSVRGRVFSEEHIHPEDLEDHIVHWVDTEESKTSHD